MPAPSDPFVGVSAAWACPAELPRAYRAATGAAHDGVPLDVALTLAWPALAGLLAVPELAARMLELVHASHAVMPGEAWPPREGETRDGRGSAGRAALTPRTRRRICTAMRG